ncbi:leukocyte-specific transcript 1 protein [Pelodiscus sinensis]|uniref:leukocyte-specific transcript 1 protein n=1 Tax=Pelodiscus sinensis TaxID=13735 RepID=UPI003F6D9B12
MINCTGSNCTVSIWGVSATAGGIFVLLVFILVLSVCLCRLQKRVKKLMAWKDGAELRDRPDVHYASLQNLGSPRVETPPPAPPAHRETDYASVAELRGPGGETDPGDAAPEPQGEGGAATGPRERGREQPGPLPLVCPVIICMGGPGMRGPRLSVGGASALRWGAASLMYNPSPQ